MISRAMSKAPECPLNEIMPQDASRILVDPNISGNVDRVIFDHWSSFIFPLRSKQLSDFCESCETPVALLNIESMVGSYSDKSAFATEFAP